MDNELFPLTKENGFERDFKLRDQILSSSGSIMDNIAEDSSGYKPDYNKREPKHPR